MRVLVVSPRPTWALSRIARALRRHCAGTGPDGHLDIDIASAADDAHLIRAHADDYDRAFVLDWRCAEQLDLPRHRTLTAVHSHKSWDAGATTPTHFPLPPPELIDRLAAYAGVQLVSRRLADLFTEAGLQTGTYVPNGVETADFPRAARPAGARASDRTTPLVVGCASKPGIDELKGVRSIIAPASAHAGAELLWASGDTADAEMPSFYSAIDAYVCASSSEGMSVAVLEAAATGRPVITTPVGDIPALVRHGHTGLIVDRDRRAVADAIRRLDRDREWCAALGRAAADEVAQHWSWTARAPLWRAFITGAADAQSQHRRGAA